MAVVFKCKMCGGNLEVKEGMTVCECEYCGSIQTVPQLDDEKKINLFTRANRLRQANEFDKASGVYESIVTEFPEEAEAYWGLILCKYGIEYVDDPKTGRKIPTCHRSSFDSVMDDQNFDLVMEYSDPASRAVYREEAKAIEELRVGIIEVSSKEEPYDIFICYKETDAMGERTIDSVIAQDVYDALVEKGYKVFFSRITLEDKLGQEYEPYIFAALNSAKVMLAFGTDYEYYNAVWVKNEWSRFLSLIEKGAKKTLIPCFKGIDAYDMPKEFARLQAQDMGKVGAIQDLLRGIGKILGPKQGSTDNSYAKVGNAESSALTQRGNMALEDGDYDSADGYFERALDINPSDAQAYLGKFLAGLRFSSLTDLEDKVCLLDEYKEFKRAEQFADPKLKKELSAFREANELRIERLRFLDVLKKHRKNVLESTYNEMKKASYELLFKHVSDCDKKAEDIYSEMLSLEVISERGHDLLMTRIPVVREIGNVLRDCEGHSRSTIASEGELSAYSRYVVISVLDDLLKYGFVELDGDDYSIQGAKEEKERILREEEERRERDSRQKAAFDEACERINSQIQEEVTSVTSPIEDDYAYKFRGIQREIDEAAAESKRQRENIQRQISDLRSQQSSLGLFKGKEKRALQAKIDEAQSSLNKIASEADIQAQYQPQISKLNAEKAAKIESITAEIKSKYPMPKLEDFQE